MEAVLVILQILVLVSLVVVGVLFRTYLPAYTKQKGKNVATKEDIAQITRRQEEARAEYTGSLERLRTQLSKTVHVHRAQVEMEIETYKELWDVLDELERAAQRLWPSVQPSDWDEDERKRRFESFGKSFRSLDRIIRSKRPFYPAGIFEKLDALLRLIAESAGEAYFPTKPLSVSDPEEAPPELRDMVANMLEVTDGPVTVFEFKSSKYRKKILMAIEDLCEAIRNRLSSLGSA